MANMHFPGTSTNSKYVRGKLIRSPYVTSQKFFLLNAFTKQQQSSTLGSGFGVNGIAQWNER